MDLTSIIIVICAAALVVFAIYSTVQKARGKAKSSCCGGPEAVTAKAVDDTDESHYPYRYTLSISDMACSNCARRVENTLNSMDGVWARVNLGKKEADVLAKQEESRDDFAAALSTTSYGLVDYKQVAK